MRNKSSDLVLGVMVTDRAIHAALLRSNARGTRLLRRFTRQRESGYTDVLGEGGSSGFQELPGGDEDDFSTIQFGEEGNSGGEMFLGSEFEGAGLGEGEEGADQSSTAPFVLELEDILAECRDTGFEQPDLAFCTSAQGIQQHEVEIPSAELKGKPGSSKRKKQLYRHLTEAHQIGVERDRVAFLPMTASSDEMMRFLALYPATSESVTPTLRRMKKERSRKLPALRFLDAETSLYLGLARLAFQGAERQAKEEGEERNTLVVRTGAEDTLVAFLQDGTLHHTEVLRSLTAFDAAETICSRLLLLQDEYGTGEIHQVLLLSEEDETELIDSFEMFFPEARVETLQTTLPALVQDDDQEALSGPVGAAAGAAMRVVDDGRHAHAFEEVNLLPASLLRRRLQLPISWANVAVLALLFVTVFFFMWRFFSFQSQISDKQNELQRYKQATSVQVEPDQLQARIDSLENTAQDLMKSLNVLDELLVGSSRWSRAMDKTSREIAAVKGIWVERWVPQGSKLRLEGNAVARDRVVNLADRTNGSIESLKFSEIRGWPVYSFVINVPLEQKLPRAARYLRQQVAARSDSASTMRSGVPAQATSLKNTP